MAGSNKFTATIADWKNKSLKAVDTVVKMSAQDMGNAMTRPVAEGGRMRVDTGFLRHSLVASTSEMPKIDPNAKPAEGQSYGDPDFAMVIVGAPPGATLFMGFTAAYAAHREYGVNGAPPDGFVRMNAKTWPLVVDRNARKLGVK